MKKILIFDVKGGRQGQPSYERIKAFKEFYKKNGFEVISFDTPSNFIELFEVIFYIYSKSIDNIFLSMPPFRNWVLFFFFRNRIVLDIRDGWSIAMATGYGNTVPVQKTKSKIARIIERKAISKSRLTISCTLGLVEYLKELTRRNILFIPNGYSNQDMFMVEKIKTNEKYEKKSLVKLICVGKFSEYGNDKVKLLIKKIDKFFLDKKVELNLVGTNFSKNEWVLDYIKNIGSNIEVVFKGRMDREDMYKEIFKSDFGVTIIRDTDYDYGTKIYDYILCGVPVFNYFEKDSCFTDYFKGYFHDDYFSNGKSNKKFSRAYSVENKRNDLLGL